MNIDLKNYTLASEKLPANDVQVKAITATGNALSLLVRDREWFSSDDMMHFEGEVLAWRY